VEDEDVLADADAEVLVVAVLFVEDVIVTEGTSVCSGMVGDVRSDLVDSYLEPFLAKAVKALFWFLLFPLDVAAAMVQSSSSRNLVLSLASNLSHEGRLSCRSESPDKLAFEAKDEVDPEVTAAAAAAIEAEVDTAVTEDDVDDDTGPVWETTVEAVGGVGDDFCC